MGSADGDIFYRRRLPHWQPPGATFFVTYRLAGSLPESILAQLRDERERRAREPRLPRETDAAKKTRIDKCLFAAMDKALVSSISPGWLVNREVAVLIRDNLAYWDKMCYTLVRFVIMPNHVHLLIKPLPVDAAAEEPVYHSLQQILKRLKSYTGREANRILGRSGAFWQEESYDHWVREDLEMVRIAAYIDANPVVARLCAYPEDWEWSSAHEEKQSSG
jgi:REP element-mobilizing transposase RayT